MVRPWITIILEILCSKSYLMCYTQGWRSTAATVPRCELLHCKLEFRSTILWYIYQYVYSQVKRFEEASRFLILHGHPPTWQYQTVWIWVTLKQNTQVRWRGRSGLLWSKRSSVEINPRNVFKELDSRFSILTEIGEIQFKPMENSK